MKRVNGLLIGIGAGLVGLAGAAGGLALAYKASKKHNDSIKKKIAQKEICECCGCNPDDCACECCDHDDNEKDLFEEESASDVNVKINNLDELLQEKDNEA
jgi:hypothetical protein